MTDGFLSLLARRTLGKSHLLVWKVGTSTCALQAVVSPKQGYDLAEKAMRAVSFRKLWGSPAAPPSKLRAHPEQEQLTQHPWGQLLKDFYLFLIQSTPGSRAHASLAFCELEFLSTACWEAAMPPSSGPASYSPLACVPILPPSLE